MSNDNRSEWRVKALVEGTIALHMMRAAEGSGGVCRKSAEKYSLSSAGMTGNSQIVVMLSKSDCEFVSAGR